MNEPKTHPAPEDFLHHDFHHNPDTRPQASFWRRLGGGSLSISLIIHGVLLAIAVVWIFQIIPEKELPPDFKPGGGGNAPARVQSKMQAKQRMSIASKPQRVTATGEGGPITLPEPEAGAQMSPLGGFPTDTLPDWGGGSNRPGAHQNFNTSTGAAGGGKPNPFGMIDPNANALVGSFYDLKQDGRRNQTRIGEAKNGDESTKLSRELLHDFVKRGWSERDLSSKFYQAPQRLYQTKIYMPNLKADEAPKAFNCDKEVEGSRWVAIYRGVVRPPKSGKYRFVGAGDDVLLVRFNGKMVFDYGYELVTPNLHLRDKDNLTKLTAADNKDREWKKVRKDYIMPDPLEMRMQGSSAIRSDIGGMAVGPEFDANIGTDYPIEILISEIPGGQFAAFLLIEEIGATYQKDKNGTPILPLFRLDANPAAQGDGPPYDPNGPVWQLVQGRRKVGF